MIMIIASVLLGLDLRKCIHNIICIQCILYIHFILLKNQKICKFFQLYFNGKSWFIGLDEIKKCQLNKSNALMAFDVKSVN